MTKEAAMEKAEKIPSFTLSEKEYLSAYLTKYNKRQLKEINKNFKLTDSNDDVVLQICQVEFNKIILLDLDEIFKDVGKKYSFCLNVLIINFTLSEHKNRESYFSIKKKLLHNIKLTDLPTDKYVETMSELAISFFNK